MAAKEKHKANLLKHLGNPENDFVNRKGMSKICGISEQTMYAHFTPDELTEIEQECYEIRKLRSTKQRSEVLKTLQREAKAGNVAAAKEYLDRTEGKVTDKHELSGPNGKDLIPIINVTVNK